MNKKLIEWWAGGASYDSDYQAWLTQIIADGGTQPSASVKTAQNALVVALKAGNYWSLFDSLNFLHCGDLTTVRRNVINPATFRLTQAGTVTFTDGTGCKSNGTDGYFNQGYKANQYAGIESSLACFQYIPTNSTTGISAASHGMRTSASGASCRFQLTPKVSSNGNRTHYENAAAAAWTNGNHKGRYFMFYEGGNSIIYKDGVSVDSDAVTPNGAGLITNDRFILARNQHASGGVSPTEFYTNDVAIDALLRSPSSAQVEAIDAIFATYITAAGLP